VPHVKSWCGHPYSESSWRIAEVFLVKYDHDSSMVQYKSEREKERYRLTFENLNVLCFICLVHVPNVMIFSVFFPFRTRSPLSDTYYPVLSCYHAKFNFITVITKKCWYNSFFLCIASFLLCFVNLFIMWLNLKPIPRGVLGNVIKNWANRS